MEVKPGTQAMDINELMNMRSNDPDIMKLQLCFTRTFYLNSLRNEKTLKETEEELTKTKDAFAKMQKDTKKENKSK